jgi:hypothetical protein
LAGLNGGLHWLDGNSEAAQAALKQAALGPIGDALRFMRGANRGLGFADDVAKNFGKHADEAADVAKKVDMPGTAVTKVDDAAHSAAHFEKYKDSLRAAMSKPSVHDPELAGYMDKLYRDGAQIGSGSTAAAVRHELATGEAVGNSFHSQKAAEMIGKLTKWLKNNPNASVSDISAAENVIIDLQNALNGN